MPNQNFQGNPFIYPGGMVDAYTDTPGEGTNIKIRAVHHTEILERQRRVYRGYPGTQGNTFGTVSSATTYGLFQAPPNSESFKVSFLFQASEIGTDTTFTITYNSVAIAKTKKTGGPFAGPILMIFGPWPLASPGGDTITEILVNFHASQTVELFGLRAEFSILAL